MKCSTWKNLLSLYKPDSEISRINQAAGAAPVAVSPETYSIVEKAIHYAEKSGGAFDPTLKPRGFRQIALDAADKTIFIQCPEMKLDLGGIGKGFALDQALARVQSEGSPESVSASFGGQLLFWHTNGAFGPEKILIEDEQNEGTPKSFQISSNCSISTSSNAERPGHLRDPRTGDEVARNDSVTVVASTGTEAEAWSTALFIQGASQSPSGNLFFI